MRRVPRAVVLMLGVGLAHQLIAGPGRLSPWKGGGFGMFATIESPASRFVRARIVTREGRFAISIPPKLSVDAERLRAWPTAQRTQRLAEELSRLRWVTLPPQGNEPGRETILPYRGFPPEEAIPVGARVLSVQAVEVELWQYVFESDSSPAVLRARPVTTAHLRMGG